MTMFKKNTDAKPVYISFEKDSYMNKEQIAYFKQKLLNWKEELEYDLHLAKSCLQQEDLHEADLYDRVSKEISIAMELRNKERDRQLIYQINQALERIEQGTYGFCIETGEPIGIKRLEAQPTASLSIEAQEKYERYKNSHGLQELKMQWA
jgi:DnaK suppressor protein